MKVICTQENLKNGLATVGRIISASTTLPILNNVLIKTENGLLKISSTNLEVAVVTHIRCKVELGGEITVVCKTLTDLVSNLPNKNIVLSSENGRLEVETENYHTTIKTLSPEDFPIIPSLENKTVVEIESQDIKKAIDQVIFASATNQTQPEITGVLFRLGENSLRIVATDRYRLAEKRLSVKNSETVDIIVPHKTAVELSRIIGVQDGKVEMVINETQAAFNFSDTQIISRLVDGQYPPYEQIIPSNFNTEVILEKRQLVSALRASGVFSQGVNSVRLEYDEKKQLLVLTSESSELGKSVVDIPSKVKGGSGVLILNYHYVLDCLQGMESDVIKIKILDEDSPSVLLPEGKSDYIYLVMPIKS